MSGEPDRPVTEPLAAIVAAEMREQANVWREVYPHGSVGPAAKVNFSNWITKWADQLEAAPVPAPALVDYMTADSREQRAAAFLRTYAERIRNGTAATWEIPNTVASTLEDIAALLAPVEPKAETRCINCGGSPATTDCPSTGFACDMRLLAPVETPETKTNDQARVETSTHTQQPCDRREEGS